MVIAACAEHMCASGQTGRDGLGAPATKLDADTNLVIYSGVFAPNAKLRSAVVAYGRPVPVAGSNTNASEPALAHPSCAPPDHDLGSA
jgi:hypothetical protein